MRSCGIGRVVTNLEHVGEVDKHVARLLEPTRDVQADRDDVEALSALDESGAECEAEIALGLLGDELRQTHGHRDLVNLAPRYGRLERAWDTCARNAPFSIVCSLDSMELFLPNGPLIRARAVSHRT